MFLNSNIIRIFVLTAQVDILVPGTKKSRFLVLWCEFSGPRHQNSECILVFLRYMNIKIIVNRFYDYNHLHTVFLIVTIRN